MSGIGILELVIIVVVGLVLIAIPLTVIFLLIVFAKKPGGSGHHDAMINQLREENEHLREQLAATRTEDQAS